MRVAFINPRGKKKTEWIPLGLARLATLARNDGFDVTFFDEEASPKKSLDITEFDTICITGMSHQRNAIKKWCSLAKSKNKRVVVGGIHASVCPDDLDADCVVVGPGESVLKPCITGEANGLIHTDFSDYDGWPLIDRKWLGWHKYNEQVFGVPGIRVVGGLGCPFNCKFCCNKTLTHGRMIIRHPDKVIAEIEKEKSELGIGATVFAMSNFTVNKKWASQMSEGLLKANIKWKATTRVDLVNREVLQTMKDCGCAALGFGVESGSERVLKAISKEVSIDQIVTAFDLCKQIGLQTWAMFMEYLPGETKQDRAKTRELAKLLNPPRGCTFQKFVPLPGSEFWKGNIGQ